MYSKEEVKRRKTAAKKAAKKAADTKLLKPTKGKSVKAKKR
jgi:hypothetical protein